MAQISREATRVSGARFSRSTQLTNTLVLHNSAARQGVVRGPQIAQDGDDCVAAEHTRKNRSGCIARPEDRRMLSLIVSHRR